jgi:large repetitive protein
MRLKLALVVLGVFGAIAVSGASAADFNHDDGPCFETPGEALLGRCPTGYVGVKYEIQIVSEEGSGCEPYDYFELVNSALPPGLSLTREGVISGVPTVAGFTRFWLWDRDQTFAQGGPDWCQREDKSEREFSMAIDPGIAIINASVKPATVGQPYTDTLAAKQVPSLNSPSGPDVQATWSLQSGALPPGITFSESGGLSGAPTAEGSYQFDIRAYNGGPEDTNTYTLNVRQPLSVKSPFARGFRPGAEVGIRLGKTFTATGGSGAFTWSVSSGALPAGVVLDPAKGTVAGVPTDDGDFAFDVTATDSEGRATSVNATLSVEARLAISTTRLKGATAGSTYRAVLRTSGGVKPLKWSVARGTLPRGLKLSQKTGTISGTPRQSGSFRVTLGARDVLGAKSQKKFVLLVTG